MGASIRSQERRSQATPLSMDIIKVLQGELDQGAFGGGVGPAQRRAIDTTGTLLDRLMEGTDLSHLIESISTTGRRGIQEQAVDLRESMGAQGARFGSQLGQAEGRMRREGQQDLTSILAQVMEQGRQFDTQAALHGSELLGGLGNMSMAPFMALAQLGILPEELFQQDSPWAQLGGAALGGAGHFFGGPGGAIVLEKILGGGTGRGGS